VSAPPFTILYVPEAERILTDLQRGSQVDKLKKIRKALRLLATQGPRYPALNTHRYESVPGPGGEPLWESYVENHTPSAWRIWWIYGPGGDDITIVTIGPHP
jgi:hypothetical protein